MHSRLIEEGHPVASTRYITYEERPCDEETGAGPSDAPGVYLRHIRGRKEGELRRKELLPSMHRTSQAEAQVSSAVGGYTATAAIEERTIGRRPTFPQRHGGGPRGRIKGPSRASLRRFGRKFAAINRPAFRARKGRVFFVTATYSDTWPVDPAAWKTHLRAFRKRLTRRYGEFAGFWRLGFQQRGAPHFHILLYVPPSFGKLKEVRDFVARAWHEVIGDVSEGHLRAGTSVDEVKSWRRVGYAARYMAKREEFPEGLETGKVWGAWSEGLLPVRWVTVKVSLRDAFKVRRIFRKLARRRGRGRLSTMTVFAEHDNVVRLLAFLGYRME